MSVWLDGANNSKYKVNIFLGLFSKPDFFLKGFYRWIKFRYIALFSDFSSFIVLIHEKIKVKISFVLLTKTY